MKDVTVTVDYEAAASIHENGIVILHTGNGRLYAANETGARIWSGLVRQKPLHTIATEISDEYQVPITSARDHVSAFIDDLEGHSLIRREENR